MTLHPWLDSMKPTEAMSEDADWLPCSGAVLVKCHSPSFPFLHQLILVHPFHNSISVIFPFLPLHTLPHPLNPFSTPPSILSRPSLNIPTSCNLHLAHPSLYPPPASYSRIYTLKRQSCTLPWTIEGHAWVSWTPENISKHECSRTNAYGIHYLMNHTRRLSDWRQRYQIVVLRASHLSVSGPQNCRSSTYYNGIQLNLVSRP